MAFPLRPPADAAGAAWVVGGLERPMGRAEPPGWHLPLATYVAQVIPTGFPAYACVFHPATRRRDGARVRWTEVAHRLGRVAHAEMQWHALLSGRTPGDSLSSEWDPPGQGHLPLAETRVLVERLRPFTTSPQRCWFAVWEGWGNPVPLAADVHPKVPPPVPTPWPARRCPRLACPGPQHPWRVYDLYQGPVEAAIDLAEHGRNASLWWPDDRRWCVSPRWTSCGRTWRARRP